VDPEGLVLTQHRFTRLALANPDLAPYGHAAMQVLDALHLRTGLQDHIVMGDNLAQTYLFVASGHADLGFVALSQIAHNGQLRDGSVWIVPARLYAPIRQDAVLLPAGQNSQAARQLLAYLKTNEARQIISTYGYALP
jgi:molybdate transport system substrate-binding protein